MADYGNTTGNAASFIAFDGIPFKVMPNAGGVYPDWELPTTRVERPVPRSNRVYRQNMGQQLARITLNIEFRNVDEYRRFKLAEANDRKSRLTLLAGFLSLRGETSTIYRDYEHFDYVVIDRIDNVSIPVDRIPTCTATFAVAWDPLTLKVVP